MTGPGIGDFFTSTSFSGAGNFKSNLQAWAVRWATDSNANHAGVFVGDIDGTPTVVEAMPGGARYAPLDTYTGDNAVWSNGFGLNGLRGEDLNNVRRRVAGHAISMLGTPYGWGDVIAAALAQTRLGGRVKPGPSIDQPWYVRRLIDRDTADCSQLVAMCYAAAGISLFLDGRHWAFVTPGDLAKLLRPEVRAG